MQTRLDVIGHFLQVALVLSGNDHGFNAAATRRQQLLLQTANGQHLTAQRNLAGHGDIRAHGDLRAHGHQRGAHGNAGARPVLRRGAFGHMNVHIVAVAVARRDAQVLGSAAHHRAGGLNRFLHHIAQGTGFHVAAFTRHGGRFDAEQFAADRSPGQPRHLADLVFVFSDAVVEFAHPQKIRQHRGVDLGAGPMLTQGDGFDHLAADLGQLSLQRTHAGLAGVVAHDIDQRRLGNVDFVGLQAVALFLLGNQITLGDVELFVFRVARQADHFHAIQQRPRNVHGVGGAHEHHVREIVIDLQVVIVELLVLLRVQHLEERRGRVAAVIHAHLVDFVEQKQWVAHTGLGHFLQQLTGHRADVGTPMPANLRLIAHAA